METFKKLWAAFKVEVAAAWAIIALWYAGIKSPILRVAILVMAGFAALALVVTLLPYLFLLAFIVGVVVVIYLAVTHDKQ